MLHVFGRVNYFCDGVTPSQDPGMTKGQTIPLFSTGGLCLSAADVPRVFPRIPGTGSNVSTAWKLHSAHVTQTRVWACSTAKFTLVCDYRKGDPIWVPPIHPEMPISIDMGYVEALYTTDTPIADDPFNPELDKDGKPIIRPAWWPRRRFMGYIDTIQIKVSARRIICTVSCRDKLRFLVDTRMVGMFNAYDLITNPPESLQADGAHAFSLKLKLQGEVKRQDLVKMILMDGTNGAITKADLSGPAGDFTNIDGFNQNPVRRALKPAVDARTAAEHKDADDHDHEADAPAETPKAPASGGLSTYFSNDIIKKNKAQSAQIIAALNGASAKAGVSVNLMATVMTLETGSNYNPNAVSSGGAQGLMQFLPSTFAGVANGPAFKSQFPGQTPNINNIDHNVYAAGWHIAGLLKNARAMATSDADAEGFMMVGYNRGGGYLQETVKAAGGGKGKPITLAQLLAYMKAHPAYGNDPDYAMEGYNYAQNGVKYLKASGTGGQLSASTEAPSENQLVAEAIANTFIIMNKAPIEPLKRLSALEDDLPKELFADVHGNVYWTRRYMTQGNRLGTEADPWKYYLLNHPGVADAQPVIAATSEYSTIGTINQIVIVNPLYSTGEGNSNVMAAAGAVDPVKMYGFDMLPRVRFLFDETLNPANLGANSDLNQLRSILEAQFMIWGRDVRGCEVEILGNPSLYVGDAVRSYGMPYFEYTEATAAIAADQNAGREVKAHGVDELRTNRAEAVVDSVIAEGPKKGYRARVLLVTPIETFQDALGPKDNLRMRNLGPLNGSDFGQSAAQAAAQTTGLG